MSAVAPIREGIAPPVAESRVEIVDDEDDADFMLESDEVSFFSDHPHADELAANRVYRVYLRESIERGHASDPKPAARRADADVAKADERGSAPEGETWIEPARRDGAARSRTEKTMAQTRDLNEREQQVLDTYNAIKRDGGVPVQRVIAEKLGWEMPSGQTRVSRAIIALRKLGLVHAIAPGAEEAKPKVAKAVREPKQPPRIPKSAPVAKTNGYAKPRATGSQGVVDALRAEIATHERKATALREALAIVEDG